MNKQFNFQEESYKKHEDQFQDYISGKSKEEHAKTWLEKDTVDAWRHNRLYEALDPILMADPSAVWLTVGDGRYGKDANYILDRNCNVLASDISDDLLKEAKEIEYISNYKKENAESLSFEDSSFDYVFCKESYHHFPRPMVALYEMLRVAKKGVLLIEPNDQYITNNLSYKFFNALKYGIKPLLGRRDNTKKHGFEESGNYVFSISRREIEKVALGLNYRTIAFKGINNAYLKGVEYEKISVNGPLQKKLKVLIGVANLLCRLHLMDYGVLAAIIFKQEPAISTIDALNKAGFKIIHLPQNPFISV